MDQLLNTLERRLRTQPPLRSADRRLVEMALSTLRDVTVRVDPDELEQLQEDNSRLKQEATTLKRNLTRVTNERNSLQEQLNALRGDMSDVPQTPVDD